MASTRRTLTLLILGTGACLLAGPAAVRLLSQEQAPNRRELTITARNYQFTPGRIEVLQDDLIRLVVKSEDLAYSLTIDEYRLSKRVPAGGSTTLEFRADRTGTFPFYSNLTTDARHSKMRGELVVRAR
jgi:heme/copper-type cytochrome/quinol oxidase subunit 2